MVVAFVFSIICYLLAHFERSAVAFADTLREALVTSVLSSTSPVLTVEEVAIQRIVSMATALYFRCCSFTYHLFLVVICTMRL